MILTWPNWVKAIFGPDCGFTIWRGSCGSYCVRYRGHPLPHRSRYDHVLGSWYWDECDYGNDDTMECVQRDGKIKRTPHISARGV